MTVVNDIATYLASRGPLTYLEIEVDGKPLAHYFTGRQGAYPSQVSVLGWSSAASAHRTETVGQLLVETPSVLESGRVPVLVCDQCGDVTCGAIAVRIIRQSDSVKWTDWMYENGYDPPRPLDWPTQPGDFVFNLATYESAIRRGL